MKSVCNSTTCLLVLACSLSLVYSDSAIILNGTTSLIFPDNQLERFYDCACSNFSNICTVHFDRENGTFKINEINRTKKFSPDHPKFMDSDKSIICDKPDQSLMLTKTFNCIRAIGNLSCNETNTLCKTCEVGSVNISWAFAETVEVKNYDDLTDEDTTCKTIEHDSEINDTNNTEASVKSEENNLPLIIGVVSGAAFFILVIVIVFIVCRCKRQKSKSSERKGKNITSPACVSARYARDNSNYEKCEIEQGISPLSGTPVLNNRTSKITKDDYDYPTVESENDNMHDNGINDYDYTTVGNQNNNDYSQKSTVSKLRSKSNKTEFKSTMDNDNYSTVDIMPSTEASDTDSKTCKAEAYVSEAAETENDQSENVEYAVVDKSKKARAKNRPDFTTVDDIDEPNSLESATGMTENKPEIPKDCEYTEINKPKPNPKDIYNKLGEQVRNFENPYNAV